MPTLVHKNRIYLASALLLFYLAGAFRGPLVEGLHIFAHLAQQFSAAASEQYFRSHQQFFTHSHDSSTHQHRFIVVIDNCLDALAQDAAPADPNKSDQLKKKVFECLDVSAKFTNTFSYTLSHPRGYFFQAIAFSPAVPTPPPQV